jgi:hypothetical protein
MVEHAIAELRRAQLEGLDKLRQGEAGVRTAEFLAPEVQIEAKAPPALFSTDDDFAAASRKLIARKALKSTVGESEDEPEEEGEDTEDDEDN